MLLGKRKFTAVDIGSHSIKVARMRQKGKKLEIIDTGIAELPNETVIEGKIQDPSIVAAELENIFEKMKYHPSRIVTTVSTNNLLVRNLELPLMSEDELAESIKWEADDQLPFPVNLASMDYLILEKDESTMKILLVAVKEDIIENFLQPFNNIGIKPDVVNVQPMALLSLLEYQGELDEPVAVVDVGASRTQVTIGSKTNINLSRTISTGGNDFTNSIIEGMGYSFKEAEKHKIKNGIEGEKEEKFNDFDLDSLQVAATGMGGSVLDTLVANLAEEISRSLDFYSMKHRGRKINKIFITGGGSRLKGLQELISKEINQNIRILDTYKGFEFEEINDFNQELSVAIGLGASEVLES